MFNENDEPLIKSPRDQDDGNNGNNEPKKKLGVHEYTPEEKRKERILNFGFIAVMSILVFAIILIFADFHAQNKGYDSSIIKECFSLITYIATAALGFIFGTSSK